MSLEKKMDKGAERWLLKNSPQRLDKMLAVLDKMRALAAKSFPSDEAADQRKYGLDKPVVKITSEDGKRKDKVVFAASRDGKWYAAREKEPATYEIEKTDVEELRKAIAALK